MNNPSDTEINLEVKVKGTAVSGPSQLTIAPHSRGSYELTFAPAVVGQHKGRCDLNFLLISPTDTVTK